LHFQINCGVNVGAPPSVSNFFVLVMRECTASAQKSRREWRYASNSFLFFVCVMRECTASAQTSRRECRRTSIRFSARTRLSGLRRRYRPAHSTNAAAASTLGPENSSIRPCQAGDSDQCCHVQSVAATNRVTEQFVG
jgi:hypothetical protein